MGERAVTAPTEAVAAKATTTANARRTRLMIEPPSGRHVQASVRPVTFAVTMPLPALANARQNVWDMTNCLRFGRLQATASAVLSRRDSGRRHPDPVMTQRVGIGIVGAGRMGSIHARLIARSVPEAHLVGIADVNLPAARRLADELGGPPAFGSLDEMLAALGLQAVLIATSSNRHAEA